MPRVSIVIPCYNQGEYIGDALESVSAQTFTDLETIIIDDGSTDAKTRDVLSQVPNSVATVVRKPNGGLAAARNSGIERASGEYILPLDADDKIAPTCVEESVAAMERSVSSTSCWDLASLSWGARRTTSCSGPTQARCSSALAPDSTTATEWPSRFRQMARNSRIERSSSTTRIRPITMPA